MACVQCIWSVEGSFRKMNAELLRLQYDHFEVLKYKGKDKATVVAMIQYWDFWGNIRMNCYIA